MKSIGYYIRVITISLEAVALVAAALTYFFAKPFISNLMLSSTINEELQKYIMLAPIGITVWLLVELRQLVFEDEKTAKLLVSWPSYWKLKAHIFITLVYCCLFSLLAIIPWLTKDGIKNELGFTLFWTGIAGLLIVAATVYMARFAIKEKIVSANL